MPLKRANFVQLIGCALINYRVSRFFLEKGFPAEFQVKISSALYHSKQQNFL
jgi:hypothetical protein